MKHSDIYAVDITHKYVLYGVRQRLRRPHIGTMFDARQQRYMARVSRDLFVISKKIKLN